MSFVTSIETDQGTSLKVTTKNYRAVGNALLSFITPMYNYCYGNDDIEIEQWLHSFGEEREAICKKMHTLFQAQYSGDWDYQENEFVLFQQNNPDYPIQEDDFKGVLLDLADKWVNIQELLKDIHILITSLPRSSLLETWWYNPQYTIFELECLENTVQQAVQQGSTKVRIKFE